jgi:hypothetical protein
MTEAEWLGCEEAKRMLGLLERILNFRQRADRDARSRGLAPPQKASDRKLRLFGCAWCRWLRAEAHDDVCRHAVEVAERFADGQATADELAAAHQPLRDRANLHRERFHEWSRAEKYAYEATFPSAGEAGRGPVRYTRKPGEPARQVALLRELFGNPFRPAVVDLSWLTPTVTALARVIYDERSFEDMPILADALEEAGCTDTALLEHLRGTGPHARGCWVLDSFLGKS